MSQKRWLVLVLLRRAGKTTGVINYHQFAAMNDGWERRRLRSLMPSVTDVGLDDLCRGRFCAHILPTYRQAKLTTWDMAKYFAKPIPGVRFNEAELRIDYPNGSKLQLFGADKPDRLRGPAFSGVSFDEHPPNVFSEVISKALHDDRELITKGLMTQEEFNQEWLLSTDAAIKGAYYTTALLRRMNFPEPAADS